MVLTLRASEWVSLLSLYYESNGITIYHADCRELALSIRPDLVLADPPYGVSERTNRKSNGRGNLAEGNDFPPVFGDDKPFDPTYLLTFSRVIMFGANHYADRLPASPSWIVWDKRDGIPSNDNADCELAWSILGGPARLYRHLWNGAIRASERQEPRVHPTQKPVNLMARLIDQYTKPADLIFDPYMGSGSTLVAAANLGRRAVGVEIMEQYCAVAVERLAKVQVSLFT